MLQKPIRHECYSNIVFPNFEVITQHYLFDKSLSFKCPYCIHTNTTKYIDNKTHRNVISMILIQMVKIMKTLTLKLFSIKSISSIFLSYSSLSNASSVYSLSYATNSIPL